MTTLIVYAMIFIFLLAITIRNPPVALTALFCMYGIKQWAQSVQPFFASHSTLTNFLVGALMAVALFVMFIKNDSIFKGYPLVGWLTIALFFYSYISIQWVSVPEISYGLWIRQMPYIFTVLLMSPLLISSTRGLSISFIALLPLGTVIIALLLFNANWTYRGVEMMGLDGQKMMGNPLAVAELAGYVMLTVSLMSFEGKMKFWQLVKWVIVAGCLVLAVKSGSRGQFISMIITYIAFLPLSRRIENPFQFSMLICGIVVLGFLGSWAFETYSFNGNARWNSMKMEGDVAGRYHNAIKLLSVWYSTPATLIFGLGNSASYDPKIIGLYPHVVSLEILAEEGLIGFILFAIIITLTIKNFITSFYIVRGDKIKRSLLAVLGSILFFLFILSFKQGSMLGSTFLFAFIIYLGKYELLLKNETGLAYDK